MKRNKITHQPRFNFRDAAFEALDDFPHLGPRTTFLLDRQNLAGSALKAYGTPQTTAQQMRDKVWQTHVHRFIQSMDQRKTSVACLFRGLPYQTIIFTPHSMLAALHPHRAAMLFFEFDHELGHLLTIKGRNITEKGTTTEAENSADAFATLRSIQRFGRAGAHLNALSCWRARCLIATGSTTHITTPVIDAIVADSAHIDFTKLTPQETICAANEYARRYCPTSLEVSFAAAQLHAAKDFINDGMHQRRLAEIVLSTRRSFAFHIGARALVPVLASNVKPQLSAEERRSLLTRVQVRARKLGFEDLLAQLQADSGIDETTTKKPASKGCGLVRRAG